MKLVAVVLLIAGMLCSSTAAIAESPIPFNALMQAAGTQPAVPAMPDAANSASAHPATSRPMTSGGKVMTDFGIGFVGVGVALIAIGASARGGTWFAPQIREVGFGAGAGFAGVGTTLIVLGHHRRKSE